MTAEIERVIGLYQDKINNLEDSIIKFRDLVETRINFYNNSIPGSEIITALEITLEDFDYYFPFTKSNKVDEDYINFTDMELNESIKFLEETVRGGLEDNLYYQMLISERNNRKKGNPFENARKLA